MNRLYVRRVGLSVLVAACGALFACASQSTYEGGGRTGSGSKSPNVVPTDTATATATATQTAMPDAGTLPNLDGG